MARSDFCAWLQQTRNRIFSRQTQLKTKKMSPTFRFFSDLQMPLRDALRGVTTLADATEEALEPVSRLLPEALRSRFHNALVSLEKAGKRLITAPIDTGQIKVAAGFLTAADTDRDARRASALVFTHAWEHLMETSVDHRYIVSETIIADRLSRVSKAQASKGTDFAASVIASIRSSLAIGRMPGLSRGPGAKNEAEVDLALLSIATWLLSSRAETMSEEEKLLDLSFALVRALHDEVDDIFDDQVALSHFLAETSTHL